MHYSPAGERGGGGGGGGLTLTMGSAVESLVQRCQDSGERRRRKEKKCQSSGKGIGKSEVVRRSTFFYTYNPGGPPPLPKNPGTGDPNLSAVQAIRAFAQFIAS